MTKKAKQYSANRKDQDSNGSYNSTIKFFDLREIIRYFFVKLRVDKK
jgi:hypothetical protein